MLLLVRECIFYVVLQEATTTRIFFTSYCEGASNNKCLFGHIARSDNDDNIVMLYLERSNDIYSFGDARSDSNCIFYVVLGGSKQRNNSTIVRCKDATIKYFTCWWLQWWWQHEYFFGRIARQTACNLFALCMGELQQACQPRQVMAFLSTVLGFYQHGHASTTTTHESQRTPRTATCLWYIDPAINRATGNDSVEHHPTASEVLLA